MSKVLYENGGVRLVAYDQLTDSFRAQIQSTVLGREGKLRYQHTHGLQKAERLKKTKFVELHWRSKLIGVVAFSLQELLFCNQQHKLLYVRYFSMSGLLSKRQGQASHKPPSSSGNIKSVIRSLFDNPSLLFPEEKDVVGIYAYVEEDNLPSRSTVELMGFESAGTFTTLIYSRIQPKQLCDVQYFQSQDDKKLFRSLQARNKEYNFAHHPAYLSEETEGQFAAIYDGEEFIASVFYSTNEWKIESIPGISGWMSKRVLSKIPYARTIFFDSTLDFLTLEMAFIKEGHEATFPRLIESLMAKEGKHRAMLWVDPTSSLHRQLKKAGPFGLLQKLSPGAKAAVYFKPTGNFTLQKGPCYISADGIS